MERVKVKHVFVLVGLLLAVVMVLSIYFVTATLPRLASPALEAQRDHTGDVEKDQPDVLMGVSEREREKHVADLESLLVNLQEGLAAARDELKNRNDGGVQAFSDMEVRTRMCRLMHSDGLLLRRRSGS